MSAKQWWKGLRLTALVCAGVLMASSAAPAIKNMAVVAAAGSKLQDVTLAELAKLCKGEQKTWAVGILDVYAINSAVKVLRIDGKLPFDVGYALKGN